jgi:hypothetical protein
MRWALHPETKERIEATPKAEAICPGCGALLIPKCGLIVIHHWAHKANKDCDPWWEPEGEWHRNWKALVQPEATEVVIRRDGIQHRADIVGDRKRVIELQHSSISPQDIQDREAFYEKMTWVFDVSDSLERLELESRQSIRWLQAPSFLTIVKHKLFLDVGCSPKETFVKVPYQGSFLGEFFEEARYHLDLSSEPCLFRVEKAEKTERGTLLTGKWLSKIEFIARHLRTVCLDRYPVEWEYAALLIEARKRLENSREQRRYKAEIERKRVEAERVILERERTWLRLQKENPAILAEASWNIKYKKGVKFNALECELLEIHSKSIIYNYRRQIIEKSVEWPEDRWVSLKEYLHKTPWRKLSFKERTILDLISNIDAARRWKDSEALNVVSNSDKVRAGLYQTYDQYRRDLESKTFSITKMERVSQEWPCDICLSYEFPTCRRSGAFLDCYHLENPNFFYMQQEDRSCRVYWRYSVFSFWNRKNNTSG